MEREYEQKRCKVDNALLFEVSKDGQRVQIKCRKCGSVRVVNLSSRSEHPSPPARSRVGENNQGGVGAT